MGCDHDLAAKRKERVNRRSLVRFKAARLGLAASEAVGPRDCARSSDGAAAMIGKLLGSKLDEIRHPPTRSVKNFD